MIRKKNDERPVKLDAEAGFRSRTALASLLTAALHALTAGTAWAEAADGTTVAAGKNLISTTNAAESAGNDSKASAGSPEAMEKRRLEAPACTDAERPAAHRESAQALSGSSAEPSGEGNIRTAIPVPSSHRAEHPEAGAQDAFFVVSVKSMQTRGRNAGEKVMADMISGAILLERIDPVLERVPMSADSSPQHLAAADSLEAVPHAGIRTTLISRNELKCLAACGSEVVFQLPIGVAALSDFVLSGWIVLPMTAFPVLPAPNEENAASLRLSGIAGGFRAADAGSVRTSFGLEKHKGPFTFSLNYRVAAGSHEHLNNVLNAYVRYAH